MWILVSDSEYLNRSQLPCSQRPLHSPTHSLHICFTGFNYYVENYKNKVKKLQKYLFYSIQSFKRIYDKYKSYHKNISLNLLQILQRWQNGNLYLNNLAIQN